MPAPKRESSPHDPPPKIRKLDEDGDALPSKTSPATNKMPHNTGNAQEKTATPRTTKKLSSSVEGENNAAISSKQGSPPNDSSKTVSDPPIKKAKLLIATSASCGEAPSQKANSKASLKRTASTESEDDELSGDGSKTDLFRERDDGDKARCIRQYSNRVKAKRRAEESSSDPQETSQGSPSAPTDTIQMDHNYGRFSDLVSTQSSDDGDQDLKKESAHSVTKAESHEIPTLASQKVILPFAAGAPKAAVEFESANEDDKHEELKNGKHQKLSEGEGATPSSGEVTCCVTDPGCITSESSKSRKDVDNETLALVVETLYSCSGETNPGCESQAEEKTDLTSRSPTDVCSETEIKDATESVSEQLKLEIKCRSKEEEHKVKGLMEAGCENVCIEDGANDANSASEGIQLQGVNPESPTTTGSAGTHPETQTDFSFKIQVTFKEESKSEHLQDRVRHDVPYTITNSCDGVHKTARKSEAKLEDGVEFLTAQAADGPESLAEPEVGQEVTDKTSDSCAGSQTDVFSEGQIDLNTLTEIAPEQRPESALEGDLQNQENHNVEDHSTETPGEVPDEMNSEHITAAPPPCISNPTSTAEIQSSKNQEVSERDTWDKSEELNENHVNSNVMENEDKVGLEMQTTLTSEDVNPQPATEIQSQDTQEVSECTTEISAEGGQKIGFEKSEMMDDDVSERTADASAEGPQDIVVENPEVIVNEVHFECSSEAVTSEVSHPQCAAQIQLQENHDEGSEHITRLPDRAHNHPVNAAGVEVNTATSEDVPAAEMQVQEVSEPTTDTSDKAQEDLSSERVSENADVTENQREIEVLTSTTSPPEEQACDAAAVETENQGGEEINNVAADAEEEKDLIIAGSEKEETKEEVTAGHYVDAAETQTQMDAQATAASREVCSSTSTVEAERVEVSEHSTEVVGDELKLATESTDVPEAQINMETETAPEEQKNLGMRSEEVLRPLSVANSDMHIHESMEVKSGPIEKVDAALEEETGREVIDEVKEEAGGFSSDNGTKIIGNVEGAAAGEVVVFVCSQPDDTDVVCQASEEQAADQPEVEIHENQVVYEPISSPESDDGREIPAASSTENHCDESLLGMQILQTQQLEERPANEGSGEICPHLTENVTQQICISDSRAAGVEAAAAVTGPETGGVDVDVGQVAVISSSDDINVPEDVTDRSESNGHAEVSAQLQEDGESHAIADVVVSTAEGTTIIRDDVPDTSEEYVILEPIPQSEVHFDIVTQAAAESGLSVSLSEQVNPESMLVGEEENGGISDSSQQTVLPEVEVQQTPEEVRDAPEADSHETLDGEAAIPADTQAANEDCDALVVENAEGSLDLQEVQILEDMEIGHEIVVAEMGNEEDSDISIIEKPQKLQELPSIKSEEKLHEDTSGSAVKSKDDKNSEEPAKPKKQEMNTQARTKARLAALAEQKAAAARRSANRQQLNLLALCQEIAEDIATDSMLLKRIEEEKQAAAAAAAAAAAEEAAKSEASRKETPPVSAQDSDAVDVATPAGPEGCSASATPTEEVPAPQPTPTEPAEAKPAGEAPKRRFFISQVSVPLKVHEKKKLTRYQRLRQVELQREKMSWARVKKLKSDQANQMFSDIDWQAPLSAFSAFPASSASTPPPAASPSKTPLPSPDPAATTVTPAASAVAPKVDAPKAEPPQSEPIQTEPTKAETAKTEPPKSGTPHVETRKSARQAKAQTSTATPSPAPTQKVTRSASKRSLPAVPPPMPNGLAAQKPKPVEYKPYRPRPKFSFEDFELDDDDPVTAVKPSTAQPARPTVQAKPAGSSQPSNQAGRKAQPSPAGQISGQPKAAVAVAPQSKAAASPKAAATPKAQLKSPLVTTPQSRAVSAAGLSRPAGSSSSSQAASSTTMAAPVTSGSQKTSSPLPAKDGKSKDSAEPLPNSSVPSEGGTKVSDGAQSCKEKPLVSSVDTSPEIKTETAQTAEKTSGKPCPEAVKPHDDRTPLSDSSLQREVKKLKESDKDGTQTIIDAGQKHFGAVACSVCGMLYSAANPEDESQHLLFHNQFISAVKYVGWKKERILGEYPDGKIILVLPDDPKYALKKVEEIREVVDSDLGFQQVETKCPSKTKTFLFISNDKKVGGCLIAEHIQEGYRVIEEPVPEGSEGEKVMFERQRAWCCSTTPEPAICGISRIWVVSMMRRQGIASRMLECLRNNFIYGSYLSKDEIAFSDPTPDGKLFATHYFGTSQFLVYNFVSGTQSSKPKTETV